MIGQLHLTLSFFAFVMPIVASCSSAQAQAEMPSSQASISCWCKFVSVNCFAFLRPREKLVEGGPNWFPVGMSRNTANIKTKMTRQSNPELLNTVLQLLNEAGSGGFAEGIRLLVNEAMLQERSQALQAQPYERTDARLGHANGFKPKTLVTRSGPIQFQVPQVRGDLNFYPAALQKGIRSEQALKLALAERYVQGVSTRKVSAIVEQLCGQSVSSTQVSQCAARLDAQLEAWRTRPLEPCR